MWAQEKSSQKKGAQVCTGAELWKPPNLYVWRWGPCPDGGGEFSASQKKGAQGVCLQFKALQKQRAQGAEGVSYTIWRMIWPDHFARIESLQLCVIRKLQP